MKKLGCAKCGGTKKMAKGGTTKSVSISKPGAGVVKETKGNTNQKMGIYGIAQTGPTGPNDSGIATMKKGGMVKKPLAKAQMGKTVKKVGPNKYAKEQVIVNKKDGSAAAYVATNKGTVYSMSDKKNGPSGVLSIDTTGYSKGKPTYDQLYTGRNGYKKTTVKRKDVKPLLTSMKKEVLSSKKVGGVVKPKKK